MLLGTRRKSVDDEFASMQPPEFNGGFAAVIVLLWYLCSALFFKLKEGWPWWEAFYFLSVTITTVGYGDVYPDNPAAKIGTMVVVITGAIVVSTCLGVLVNAITSQSQRVDAVQAMRGKLLLSLGVLCIVILVGAVWVRFAEQFSLLDSFYWAVVSATAIGYGDLNLGDTSKVCSCILPRRSVSMRLTSLDP